MKKIISVILGIIIVIFIIGLIVLISDSPMQKWEDFDNQALKNNIEIAFEQIGFNTSNIKLIGEVKEWSSGPLYRMEYNDDTYYIYAYDNGQINSINKDLQGHKIYSNENVELGNDYKNAIVLKYGELGKYGKNVQYDGQNYIKYFLPEGKYEVEALTRNAMFFIEDTKIYKNSSGYDASKTIDTIQLSDVGSKQTITLQSNNCINLVINSSVSIKKAE